MATILGVSGSLRRQSFNTALLREAAALMPAGSALDVRTIHGIPLYNADDETAHGLPAAVTTLKDAMVAADGVILATPEYNNSLPGVFKNAIDWLSRPPADIKRVFGGKQIAIIGASPGGFGTILSQSAWLPVLRTLGTDPFFGARLQVGPSAKVFDESGALIDDAVRASATKFIAAFAEFAAARRRPRS